MKRLVKVPYHRNDDDEERKALEALSQLRSAYSATEAPSIRRIMLLSHRKPLRND